jgi:hypothetical protein
MRHLAKTSAICDRFLQECFRKIKTSNRRIAEYVSSCQAIILKIQVQSANGLAMTWTCKRKQLWSLNLSYHLRLLPFPSPQLQKSCLVILDISLHTVLYGLLWSGWHLSKFRGPLLTFDLPYKTAADFSVFQPSSLIFWETASMSVHLIDMRPWIRACSVDRVGDLKKCDDLEIHWPWNAVIRDLMTRPFWWPGKCDDDPVIQMIQQWKWSRDANDLEIRWPRDLMA